MAGVRDILNEIKWREGLALERTVVRYVHRGAPGDSRAVAGKEIVALHPSFVGIRAPSERGMAGTAMIPYHHVFEIVHDGEVLWRRRLTASDEEDRDDERGREN